MTREEKIEIIREVAAVIGGTVRDDYSGRGMYGATCYGIDCDDAQDCIEEAAGRRLRGGVTDNMGLGYIVYWPSVKGEEWMPEPATEPGK